MSRNTELVTEQALERLRELVAFQSAARTPQGQAVMEHLRRITGADKSSFRPGDPNATAFACGLRDAYLLMKQDAERDPKLDAEKLKLLEDHNNNKE